MTITTLEVIADKAPDEKDKLDSAFIAVNQAVIDFGCIAKFEMKGLSP